MRMRRMGRNPYTVTTVPRAHVVLQITIFVSCFAFLVKSFNPPWPADVCLRYEINIFLLAGLSIEAKACQKMH